MCSVLRAHVSSQPWTVGATNFIEHSWVEGRSEELRDEAHDGIP